METSTRQDWLSVLAHTPPPRLRRLLSPQLPPAPQVEWLRRAETGLVMLQARAGGGARFNLGEASVSRASCRIAGRLGHGWALGSNGEHAELIAQADALLQDPARQDQLLALWIAPLRAERAARRDHAAREAAASKVEFFTLVRGE
ncbi:phosphonate C-P lyase system protein PhnG [Chromobacterium haemolyticum]|uniref:Phosphonate C-P lyase system protein PhnG n=1 Tax=Chromobacterium haemolyticum TaxID=394935 RepID=A0ABS3GIF7_9NEIS|nr:phosphonate C-P lyase system protein PhnG [Chromobacterium haemolyticum]MBK0413718.1 phosphonate C-P lyase system protein PhnG [Chromobacterium haemolyticum]MBO0414820.1 phosphonate C-P lyase system protein PhnG [Chromobacterium haemolyticum]MBO0498081.1 phosphonate C-P lyase system protein PhnG [Chromobacterium haemolyticum]